MRGTHTRSSTARRPARRLRAEDDQLHRVLGVAVLPLEVAHHPVDQADVVGAVDLRHQVGVGRVDHGRLDVRPEPRRVDRVDPYDLLVAAEVGVGQPPGDDPAGLVLQLRDDRVLEVQHQGVGLGVEALAQHLLARPGDEVGAAAQAHRHARLRPRTPSLGRAGARPPGCSSSLLISPPLGRRAPPSSSPVAPFSLRRASPPQPGLSAAGQAGPSRPRRISVVSRSSWATSSGSSASKTKRRTAATCPGAAPSSGAARRRSGPRTSRGGRSGSPRAPPSRAAPDGRPHARAGCGRTGRAPPARSSACGRPSASERWTRIS